MPADARVYDSERLARCHAQTRPPAHQALCARRYAAAMSSTLPVTLRPLRPEDQAQWRPLWDGYNAFYGRQGDTALPEAITAATWQRFLDPAEPVHALVAQQGGQLVALVHYLYHRSTTRLHDVCFLQDLFTAPSHRGQGIGRRLIEAVVDAARAAGSSRVYWQTHHTNVAGRALYDQVATNAGFVIYGREL